MDVSKQYAFQANVDPFGVSTYLCGLRLLFVVWGKLGELIGGIDFFHMRVLHAVVGLATCRGLLRALPANAAAHLGGFRDDPGRGQPLVVHDQPPRDA